MGIGADNRRSSKRQIVSLGCTLIVDDTVRDGTIVNLSLGGALIEAGVNYAMGVHVQLSFKVPIAEQLITVGSTVRWSDPLGVGLQFDGLRARDVWALNEYFKHLSQ